jgi:predicted ATPase
LCLTGLTRLLCGDYAAATRQSDEVAALADEKGAALWKAFGAINHGCAFALTSKAQRAVQIITSAIAAWRSTGASALLPLYLSYLAKAHADIGEVGEARRCIGDAFAAMEAVQERWCEADVLRLAGEIALLSPTDGGNAEAQFERALAVAGEQQAKSWELRAAMSMARLWRDQGKREQARDLLASVYGWFTEGFDTLDLKEAKALLEQLTA